MSRRDWALKGEARYCPAELARVPQGSPVRLGCHGYPGLGDLGRAQQVQEAELWPFTGSPWQQRQQAWGPLLTRGRQGA
jgi:hypothetical protein